MNDRRFDPREFLELDDTSTLGTLLELERVKNNWNRKELAMALGMSFDKYLRVKADVDLPTLAELLAMCELLDSTPVQLRPHVKASARRVIEKTLLQFSRPINTLRAARRRGGSDVGDAETAMVEDLPQTLRETVAEDFGVRSDDLRGMAAGFRRMANAEATEQVMFIRVMAADTELEGDREAMLDLEALMGPDDDFE